MPKGYEATYEAVKHKLATCDFCESAQRLGINPPCSGELRINFLGREYGINSTGVFASDGMPSDPNIRSILIYYITSKGSGEPTYSYNMLHSFVPGSIGGNGEPTSWMTAPLIRKFENDSGGFDRALKSLGAIPQKSTRKDMLIWTYAILPKIPIKITYTAADDEFPLEIKLMLDSNAGKFMEFEQLAFLCGCFVKTVSEAAGATSPV